MLTRPTRSRVRQPTKEYAVGVDLDDEQITTPAPGLTGQIVDLALLGGCKRAKRVVSWRRQGLHLNGDTISTTSGNYIEFTTADLNITIENFQTLSGEKIAGEVLAKLAQLMRV